MVVKQLLLRNFRGYEEIVFPLLPALNRIEGKNGAGKTSLLEALYFLATGRSFLSPHLTDLIHKGKDHFYIEAEFIRDGAEQKLSVGYDGLHRRIHYNNTLFHQFSHLLGILPSTLYSPKDHALISGSPQERRRFLNIQLSQSDPLYVHHLTRYHRAMKQRNALLKMKQKEGLKPFEEVMAVSARYLMEKRDALLTLLRPKVHRLVNELSAQHDTFDLHYTPSIPLKKIDAIETVFDKQRSKELTFGSTLSGPHRDDFQITIDRSEAKSYASEGQKRSFIAALKLAEWEFLKENSEAIPLLSIDDFGIHLDQGRRALLEEKLTAYGQVLLTSPDSFSKASHHIDGGRLTILC